MIDLASNNTVYRGLMQMRKMRCAGIAGRKLHRPAIHFYRGAVSSDRKPMRGKKAFPDTGSILT